MKKIKFIESKDINKNNVNIGDSFMAYNKGIYDERLYIVKVVEIKGADIKLECKWLAISDGYDLGFKQNFRPYKNDRVWNFEGKLVNGKVIQKREYTNNVYKLLRFSELSKYDIFTF